MLWRLKAVLWDGHSSIHHFVASAALRGCQADTNFGAPYSCGRVPLGLKAEMCC